MNYRKLGGTGLEVSAVALGCNNFGMRIDLDATRAVVNRALDSGITFFDTSDSYGMGTSEVMLGEALGERRKNIVLATKFASPMEAGISRRNASRGYIFTAIEASLRRLKTDWIDLYQLHFPDPLTPTEETLRALDDLVHQGKVRYIGCSNLPAWQIVEAQWTSKHLGLHSFVTCQDEYSVLARGIETEKLTVMEKYGMGLLPYFPLACGMLTGKYQRAAAPSKGTRFPELKRLGDRYSSDQNWTAVEALAQFTGEREHSLTFLVYA